MIMMNTGQDGTGAVTLGLVEMAQLEAFSAPSTLTRSHPGYLVAQLVRVLIRDALPF
jgi:hypothetical protein